MTDNSGFERAGLFERAIAFLIDSVIVCMCCYIAIFVIALSFRIGIENIDAILFLGSLIVISYFAFIAYKNNGQTLAKRWSHLKVVDLQGNNVSLARFLARELVARGPIICLFLTPMGLAMCSHPWFLTYLLALTQGKRALHDLIAGTQVVKLTALNELDVSTRCERGVAGCQVVMEPVLTVKDQEGVAAANSAMPGAVLAIKAARPVRGAGAVRPEMANAGAWPQVREKIHPNQTVIPEKF